MANQFDQKDRRTIPNWRRFNQTVKLKELSEPFTTKSQPNLFDLTDYCNSWQSNKEISYAGDLICAAISNGISDNDNVVDAAKFILQNQDTFSVSRVLLSLSESIISSSSQQNTFLEHSGEDYISNIRTIKRRNFLFHSNPINYVDLAWWYSVSGNKLKAERAMEIALSLNLNNRFILRSAVRFFVHICKPEQAYYYLMKSDIVKKDPWVLSSEIALSTLLNKTSILMKKGFFFSSNNSFSEFSLTELHTALATVEALNGSEKKAKKLVKRALASPNDNSLAQAGWLTQNHHISANVNPLEYNNIPNSYEFEANFNYKVGDWDGAIESAKLWANDMPYTKSPVVMASHIASSIIFKPEVAIPVLKRGLDSHPNDPLIINNLAYSLALNNSTGEATKYLSLIKTAEIEDETRVCLKATEGLIEFRKGNHDLGRNLYKSAIEATKKLSNKYYLWISTLNYAREELLINSSYVPEVMTLINKIPDTTDNPAVNATKKQVENLFVKKQLS
jgi:tetratricopeptide (TPR) repeat protein